MHQAAGHRLGRRGRHAPRSCEASETNHPDLSQRAPRSLAHARSAAMAQTAPPVTLNYPDKFWLALRFGEEGPLKDNPNLNDSDRILLYALRRQAVDGPNKEPRPSMWDTVGKAK